MKVKIQNQDLRFKITEGELTQLLSGQPLKTCITIADKNLTITAQPTGHGLSVQMDQNQIHLLISPKHIQELNDIGRSRQGLQEKYGELLVSLQVDLRSDNRGKKKL